MGVYEVDKIIAKYTSENPNITVDETMFDSGGMKKVYYAEDINSSNQYVLKIVEISDGNSEKRTRRELAILDSLNSDYFPKIHDVFDYQVDGKNYVVILEQRIYGINLRRYMKENKILEAEAIDFCTHIIKALKIIHTEGLVHRDVKPENIMITDTKGLVLLDFGIARDLTDTSITSDLSPYGPMTIGYAAPEQIKNNKRLISARTDFFAWAIVSAELLNGENPLKEGCKNQSEVLQKTLKVNELNLDINVSDNNIKELIKKNLKYEVHKRSNNEEEILKLLEARK